MQDRGYLLWIDFHSGYIHRQLSEKEKQELTAYELAMHLKIPNKSLLKACGGREKLIALNLDYAPGIKALANRFKVPYQVMLIKLQYLKAQGASLTRKKKG